MLRHYFSLLLVLILPPIVVAENDAIRDMAKPNDTYAATASLVEVKELTLYAAIQLALQHNPELAAFAKEVLAMEGQTLQAGLLPNPVIEFNAEDVSSRTHNSPAARFDSIRIFQLFETAGKRSARRRAALFGQESVQHDFAALKLDLIAQVTNVYLEVMTGQERLQLALAGQELAQKVVSTAAKRVKAGKAPPIEETRARVALATAEIEVKQSQRNLASFRKQLSLFWGNPVPQFEHVLGDLETFITIPGFQLLEDQLQQNPLTQRSLKILAQREAQLTLEKARRIPNVTLNAGVRRYGHDISHDTTVLAGVSIPLPIFDRNQGNLMAAQQRMEKAFDEQIAVDLQLRTLLVQAYESLVAADTEINQLRNEILPGAREAFRMADRGYQLGRFSFLELLDAQRTLFQNQTLYLQALSNYQRLINEIERLIAQPIEDLTK